jgi:PelA/Pel-15E family pectate lyase
LGELLAPERIAALPTAERDAWTRYVASSARQQDAERAAMATEMQQAGLSQMTRAPYLREPFEIRSTMTDEWFRGDSARRIADNVLSFQTPSGGWSKHVDFRQQPYYSESDGWQYIATIDNGATTGQLLFLARAYGGQRDERYRAAFQRGLDYLHAAQFPNGCWPQVYPLQGSYHDAATFNDDAIVNVLKILRDVARDRFEFVTPDARQRANAAMQRGIDCVVASQIVVNGRRTGWAQQHDPLSLTPIAARSYELVGTSGRETAGVTSFLMSVSSPSAAAIEAVHAAVEWLRATAIQGYAYDFEDGLERKEGAGPIWARLYEIGTNRPIFSNRDGVKLYDWNQLTDRRQGYAWYGDEPLAVLRKYDETWAQRYPRRSGQTGR